MSNESVPSKRKIMRQFARTVTDQKPFSSPFSVRPLMDAGDNREWMQAITGQVHVLRSLAPVKPSENVFNGFEQVRTDPAAVPAFVKAFKAAMLKTPDH